MPYDVSLTPAQATALAQWIEPNGASVEIAQDNDGTVTIAQGDARAILQPDGEVREA